MSVLSQVVWMIHHIAHETIVAENNITSSEHLTTLNKLH
jgi:hypothetical protein